jgi:hypothetical protein
VAPVPVVTKDPIYVTIGSPEVLELETHTMIQPDIPKQCEDEYVTLYSVTNQTLVQTLPHVYFNLVNPPLIIDYDITPVKSVDEKFLEYKELSTLYQENVTIIRPYEHSWAMVIVRSTDTGQIVAEDGFGKTYSFQSPKQLVIREKGNYEFEFTGDYATMNMTMKAKREGNIP